MICYLGQQISSNQIETGDGFLICKNVPIARTGKMQYLAHELQLDGNPDKVIDVNRYPEDVFDAAAVASFEGVCVCDNHPPENLIPETASAYARGHVQNVRREGETLVGDLHIIDANLINDIRTGVKREVSCGYTCEYVPDGTNYKQTRIRGNHVAVVTLGRAGHDIAIKDSKTIKKEMGANKMVQFKKEILKLFGQATKDATPEEIEEMTETVNTLTEETTNDEMIEKAPKGDDLGSKLDRILSMLVELDKKNDREEKMERKMSDETDIDDLIEKLSEAERKEEQAEKEAQTIFESKENENIYDACNQKIADAAKVEFLKTIRPAVAGITDVRERAKVVDAIIGTSSNMGGILGAAQDNATKNKNMRKSMDTICREQKELYDAFNPHKSRK